MHRDGGHGEAGEQAQLDGPSLGEAAIGVLFVQVNTSGEESKHGFDPSAVVGLMTIGMPDYTSRPENFSLLMSCRDAIAEALVNRPLPLMWAVSTRGML